MVWSKIFAWYYEQLEKIMLYAIDNKWFLVADGEETIRRFVVLSKFPMTTMQTSAGESIFKLWSTPLYVMQIWRNISIWLLWSQNLIDFSLGIRLLKTKIIVPQLFRWISRETNDLAWNLTNEAMGESKYTAIRQFSLKVKIDNVYFASKSL